ncbi:hypothetical protein BJ741DRAFT_598021 [Chytriomyces cf. hyalinus JEL632]|nr:hypothetical protein BJ741DRAFT_598021 [Chytriomyces cf. hyalinus JEL632]
MFRMNQPAPAAMLQHQAQHQTQQHPQQGLPSAGIDASSGFWDTSLTGSSDALNQNETEESSDQTFGDFFDLSPPASPSKSDSDKKRSREADEASELNGNEFLDELDEDSDRNVRAKTGNFPTPDGTIKELQANQQQQQLGQAELERAEGATADTSSDFLASYGEAPDLKAGARSSSLTAGVSLDEEIAAMTATFGFQFEKHSLTENYVMVMATFSDTRISFKITSLDQYQKLPTPACLGLSDSNALENGDDADSDYFMTALESAEVHSEDRHNLTGVIGALQVGSMGSRLRISHIAEACCGVVNNGVSGSVVSITGGSAVDDFLDFSGVGDDFTSLSNDFFQ